MGAGKKNKRRPITVHLKTPFSASSSPSSTSTTANATSPSSSSAVDPEKEPLLCKTDIYREPASAREVDGKEEKDVFSSQKSSLLRTEASSSAVKVCRHLERGIHLNEISSKLAKANVSFSNCKDCVKDGKGIGGKKNKNKKKKGKSSRKSVMESSGNQENKWICLACGRILCGNLSSSLYQSNGSSDDDDDIEIERVSNEEKKSLLEQGCVINDKKKRSLIQEPTENEKEKAPSGHVWKHCFFSKHPIALQVNESLVCWCFMCNMALEYSSQESISSCYDTSTSSTRNTSLQEAVKIVHEKLREETGLSKDPGKKGISSSSSIVNMGYIAQGNSTDSLRSTCSSSIIKCVGSPRRRLVRGMMNLGNTCFFNSVMQNILALDMLRDYFTQQVLDFEGPLVSSLRKLYLETNSESSVDTSGDETGLKKSGNNSWENNGVCNPKSLFGAICTKAPRFKGFQQQDSHELLKCLLEGLNSEEQNAKVKETSNGVKNGASIATRSDEVTNCSRPNDDKKEKEKDEKNSSTITETTTFVESFFGGQLCSTVRCQECGHSSVVYEPMIDLSLQILTRQPSKNKSITTPTSPGPKLKKGLMQKYTKKSREVQKKESLGQVPFVENKKIPILPTKPPDLSSEGSLSSESALVDNSNVDDCAWLDFVGSGIQSAESSLQGCQNAHDYSEVSQKCLVAESQEPDKKFEIASDKKIIENTFEKEDEQLPLASGVLLLPYEPLILSEDTLKMSGIDLEEEGDNFDGVFQLFEEEESVPMNKQNIETSGYEIIDENALDDGPWETDLTTFDEDDSIVTPKTSVKFEDSFSPMSLEGCLADFTKTELLCGENAWECEKCTQQMNQSVLSNNLSAEDLDAGNASELTMLKDLNANSNGANCVATDCNRNGIISMKALEFGNGGISSSEISCNGKVNLDISEKKHGNLAYKDAKSLEQYWSSMPNNDESNGSYMRDSCVPESSNCSQSFKEEITMLHQTLVQVGSSTSRSNDLNNDNELESISTSLPLKTGGMVKTRNRQKPAKPLKRDATKRLLISKAPPILTVHLKRFAQDIRGRLNKLNGHVSFPESLDLRPFLDARCLDSNNFLYRLVGIVEHGGTMRGGHYIAYVRGPSLENNVDNESWYYISDSSVRKATLEAVLNSEAYLLFYEKCEVKRELKTQ